MHDALQHTDVCCFHAELRKDFVKRAPPVVGEVGGPVRSLAAPVLNIAQANNARGEGRVRHLCNACDQMRNMSQLSLASASYLAGAGRNLLSCDHELTATSLTWFGRHEGTCGNLCNIDNACAQEFCALHQGGNKSMCLEQPQIPLR